MYSPTRDDLIEIESYIGDIREELLKWCVMPDYMSRDRGGEFHFITRAALRIAEFCLQFDISEEYLYHHFDFKMNPKILQMEADDLSFQFNEPFVNIENYHQGVIEAYMAAIGCAANLGSLQDLQKKLEKFTNAIKLHKS